MGIGDWGLSLSPLGIVPLPPKECLASPIGDIGESPIPNPQSPIKCDIFIFISLLF